MSPQMSQFLLWTLYQYLSPKCPDVTSPVSQMTLQLLHCKHKQTERHKYYTAACISWSTCTYNVNSSTKSDKAFYIHLPTGSMA